MGLGSQPLQKMCQTIDLPIRLTDEMEETEKEQPINLHDHCLQYIPNEFPNRTEKEQPTEAVYTLPNQSNLPECPKVFIIPNLCPSRISAAYLWVWSDL